MDGIQPISKEEGLTLEVGSLIVMGLGSRIQVGLDSKQDPLLQPRCLFSPAL